MRLKEESEKSWLKSQRSGNEGQGSLACCSPRGRKAWTQLNN